jgi:hypothetical protein
MHSITAFDFYLKTMAAAIEKELWHFYEIIVYQKRVD